MSKSAPTTPPRLWRERDLIKPTSKVSFFERVSVYLIDKPQYDEEKYPWEYSELSKSNPLMSDKENINLEGASSDSQDPEPKKSDLLSSRHDFKSIIANASDNEHKERSDDEESESDSEESQEDESDEYEEGDESDEYEGEDESDEYEEDDQYSESKSESEDEYQEPKRYKPTKEASKPFPDYTSLTAEYEAFLKSAALQSPSATVVEEGGDKPQDLKPFGKRKQLSSESEDDAIKSHQPKHYKPTKEAPKPFPDYTSLTAKYEASLKAGAAQNPFVAVADVLGDEREQDMYLGKRSRDEFEEDRQAPCLASKIKIGILEAFNEGIEAFNERNADSGYYSENSDYEAELEPLELPSPLSLEDLQSSSASSSAISPADFNYSGFPESSESPFPESEVEQSGYDDEEYPVASEGRDGAVARYWWDAESEEPPEDELCQHFSSAIIGDVVKPFFLSAELPSPATDAEMGGAASMASSGEVSQPNFDFS